MAKTLVAYFSASGQTAKLAKTLAKVTNADLFEIEPKVKYTAADLNWQDKHSRSTKEMEDAACRPEMAKAPGDLSQYDTVLIGFPIWWYEAPRIIETFLDAADLTGKTVAAFATSGGSGMGNTDAILKKACLTAANWKTGKRFSASASEKELLAWVKALA